MLTTQEDETLREIIAEYKDVTGGLLPVLQKAREVCGVLPLESLAIIAEGLVLPLARVVETADFHSLWGCEPCGRYVIRICKSGPCRLNDAAATLQALEMTLGIRAGETTADGRFTLLADNCLGVCARAPAVMVNDEVYGPVFSQDVPALLARFE